MEEKSGSGWSAAISGIVMMMALVGTVAWRTQALVSPRPSSERHEAPGRGFGQTIPARLWEDPLAAIERAREAATTPGAGSVRTTSMACMQREMAKRAQEPLPDFCPSQGEGSAHEIEVLMAMVPSEHYAEDTEFRLRERHAVVSALGSAGYRADDEMNLGVLELAWPPAGDPHGPSDAHASEKEVADLPFEWFERRLFETSGPRAAHRVLLLWLPEGRFTDDVIPRLIQLVGNFRGGALAPWQPRLGLRILGPIRSSTLRAMLPWRPGSDAADAHAPPAMPKPLAGVSMCSWCATAMDELLAPGFAAEVPRGQIGAYLKDRYGLDFQSLTATDDQLATELIDELGLRGVDLTNSANHIALVGEWDSFYGRSLPVAFAVQLAVARGRTPHPQGFAATLPHLKEGQTESSLVTELVQRYCQGAPPSDAWPTLPLTDNIHAFSYLRGIDGKLPGDKPQGRDSQPPRENKPPEQISQVNERDMNRSEGRNQLDYVPRLADQIERLREDLRGDQTVLGASSLRAIGVVGSDFYDKVMILQALRDRFPDILFFTTDLDARFLHPDFLKWTRNLVVTSGFGLSLEKKFQNDIEPFRGSYQTSLFFASLCALQAVPPCHVAAPSARRFEIGRFHAIDLSTQQDLPIHPPHGRRVPAFMRWVLPMIALFSAVWLLLYFIPRLSAWITPQGRCRMVLEALWVRHEDLISPREAFNRWEELEQLATAAGLTLKHTAPARQGAQWSEEGHHGLLTLFNRILEEFSQDQARRDKTSADFRRHGNWLIGLWQTKLRRTIRHRAVAREMCERLYPTLLRPVLPRVQALTGEMRKTYVCVGLGALVVIGLVTVIFLSHSSGNGEPFSLWEGVSIWPAECLRLVAIFLTIFFLGRVMHDLEYNRQDICVEFGLDRKIALHPPAGRPWSPADWWKLWAWQRAHSIRDWVSLPLEGPVPGERLWWEYQARSEMRLGYLRPLPVLIVYAIFGVSLTLLGGGFPQAPWRGDLAKFTDLAMLFASVSLFLLLTFMVVDATRLCHVFVLHLIQETEWPPETQRRFTEENLGMRGEDLDPWIDIQIIARRTKVVAELIYYPFIVLALLVIARSSFFDAWTWPLPLIVIFILNAVWAFSSAFLLRGTARRAREMTLASVDRALARMGPEETLRQRQVAGLRQRIQEIEEGPFGSFWGNPALGAALLPFTGGGLSLLLEFLTSR